MELLLVFGVDGLDLLLHEFHVVLQFLHFAIHFVDEAVALFAGRIEETEVVLVGNNLLFQSLVAPHEASTLIIECVLALLRRSEEHTSELQSRQYLVCRLLLEKKKTTKSLGWTILL